MIKFIKKLIIKIFILIYKHHFIRAHLSLAYKMKKNISIDKNIITKEVIKSYKNKWGKLDSKPNSIYFQLYSSLRGEIDLNYVPDDLYRYKIEKILNNAIYHSFFENKNLYELRLPDYKDLFPEAIFRKINGVFYDKEYHFIYNINSFINSISDNEIVVKKALETGGGLDVYLFKKCLQSGNYYRDDGMDLIKFLNFNKDIIIQKKVCQCQFMSNINPSSINTIRVVTYKSVNNNKVYIMQMLIKKGKFGSFVDNRTSGGSFIEVKKDGKINNYSIDKYGIKYPFYMNDYNLPLYDKIKSLAIDIAEKDYINRQLSYDLFIDDNMNIRIMEINYSISPAIQGVCGPAFGRFTDEVIEYCNKESGSFVFDIPY